MQSIRFMPRGARHLQLSTLMKQASLPLLAALISFGTMQPLYAQKSGKDTTADQTANEAARVQANIDTVLAFYTAMANADFEQARQYVGHYYIEHDPNREDGMAGLQKASNPNRMGVRKTFTIEKLVGDDEYVVLHARLVPTMGPPTATATTSGDRPPAAPAGRSPGGAPPSNAQGNAGPPEFRPTEVAEIFRLFDGKIVEHWKVVQQT